MNVLPHTSHEAQLTHWQPWIDPEQDFTARLALQSVLLPNERSFQDIASMPGRNTGLRSPYAAHVLAEMSGSSSVASTPATDAIPWLTRGHSVASSIGSADTSAASALDGGYVLSIQEGGLLTVPERRMPNANLLCPFQILDCEAVFSDILDFKTHVFSHFRGYPAPLTAACFLCDETFEQTEADFSALAWNNMLSHLANDHYRRGQRLATVRTNFSLMRWMYSRRIITDAQFKRTQLCPLPTLLPNPDGQGEIFVNTPIAPMPPSSHLPNLLRPPGWTNVGDQRESFTAQAGRRTERRRRDATRAMHARVNL